MISVQQNGGKGNGAWLYERRGEYALYVWLEEESKEVHEKVFAMSLLYETGEYADRFGPGTLGAVGGMNMVTALLPDSLEEILPLLRDYQPADGF